MATATCYANIETDMPRARNMSLLNARRPMLSPLSMPSTLAAPGAPSVATTSSADTLDIMGKISASPAFAGVQIRCGPRDTYNPSHFHPHTFTAAQSSILVINMSTREPAADPNSLAQIRDSNKTLLSALEAHQAFPQQQRARSGKVYFMHDFASRTDAMFDSILNDVPAPDTPATRGSVPQAKPSTMTQSQRDELKSDVVGRCAMLHSMITDISGMTAMMFGEQPERRVDLGDAVERASQELVNGISG
ncbi:hypothetical protein OPT61_g8596 [Boeremia exigua]|uniref:Uncharacterized protein n=1 Tax=Boeremia exigua TaxID=749465 RepID=A0ACC2HZ85_9PLEO|nr:hypothetical protein OPT61_g8596 [Boeremia exigua]